MKRIAILVTIIIIVLVVLLLRKPAQAPELTTTATPTAIASKIRPPLIRANERITKKPFGIYITPQTSPVQPEKFTGYHTGVDFETFADEQTTDVAVMAICTGPLLVKRTASGYGGVVVQRCEIDGASVTIIYGHLRIADVTVSVGDTLTAGKSFAVLGIGYSSETDGERKHLHLGIHRGTTVNITGYVNAKSALSDWMDYEHL